MAKPALDVLFRSWLTLVHELVLFEQREIRVEVAVAAAVGGAGSYAEIALEIAVHA